MVEQSQGQETDILANILNDTPDGNIKGLNELNKLIHVIGGSSSNPLDKMAANSPRKKKIRRVRKAVKHKTTHYLTEEVFENLGEAKENIKDLLPDGDKMRATKSAIVESAVRVLLDEFERKGKNSYLVKEILKEKK